MRVMGEVDGKQVGISGLAAKEATRADPTGLQAARRMRSDARPEGGGGRRFDDDVRANPFHPLNTETKAGAQGPRGHSAIRSAMGGGADQEGALGIGAPARGRARGQEPPKQLDEEEAEERLAQILDPVEGVGATVERSAAKRRQGRGSMPGGLGAAV